MLRWPWPKVIAHRCGGALAPENTLAGLAIAARIGCRREQVTRELSTMTHDGLIEKTRGALVLLKPQVLESRLQEALREGD